MKQNNSVLTVNDVLGTLKSKIDFENLRKRVKQIHERVGKSFKERKDRIKTLEK